MRNDFLFLLFMLAYTSGFGIVGLAEWQAETPYGNMMNNTYGPVDLYLGDEDRTVLEGIHKWYFYKGHTIGTLNYDYTTRAPQGYFVVDEYSYEIDTFATKAAWEGFLQEHELQPMIWTRWYDTEWESLIKFIVVLFIFAFFISVPATLFYIIAVFLAIKKEKFNPKRPFTIFSLAVPAFLFIVWLLEQYPESI